MAAKRITSFTEFATLVRHNPQIEALGLRKIGVFGSFARSEAFNDIDLLVDDDISLEKALQLRDILGRLVANPVDIVLRRYANPIVLYRAQKDLRYAEV